MVLEVGSVCVGGVGGGLLEVISRRKAHAWLGCH